MAVMEGHDRVRLGWVRRSWSGGVRIGKARHGSVGLARYREVRLGLVGRGVAV